MRGSPACPKLAITAVQSQEHRQKGRGAGGHTAGLLDGSGGLAPWGWGWCHLWNGPDELPVKAPAAQRLAQPGSSSAPPVLILNLTEALLLFLILFVFRKVRGKPAVQQCKREKKNKAKHSVAKGLGQLPKLHVPLWD